MLARHYAPRRPLRLNALAPAPGEALLGLRRTRRLAASISADRGDLEEAAANLFAMLRALDPATMIGGIAVAPIPEDGLGAAINDRLRRAAAPADPSANDWDDERGPAAPCCLPGEQPMVEQRPCLGGIRSHGAGRDVARLPRTLHLSAMNTIDALKTTALCRCSTPFATSSAPKGWIDDAEALEPYLIEERRLFRGRCAAVVRPASTEEVARVVALCAEAGIADRAAMAATPASSAAACRQAASSCRRPGSNRIRAVDAVNRTMTLEAGVILADVQAAADQAGALFPLSLGAEGSCRIGGNLATNAGGLNVLRYGNARDLVLGLEVVLADGRIWNGLTGLRKNNTGYDLKQLFLGAEGTLGIITAAVVKLFAKPRISETALVAVPIGRGGGRAVRPPQRRGGRCALRLRADAAHWPSTSA